MQQQVKNMSKTQQQVKRSTTHNSEKQHMDFSPTKPIFQCSDISMCSKIDIPVQQ
jgi:hypothetical protein